MDFDEVAAAVNGVPVMSVAQGRAIYDHVRETRPEHVLELGTAHGTSACYMAAALDENGSGRITTLDRTVADYQPGPEEVLDRAGLRDYVTLVRRDDSSYDWFLKEQVAERSDESGNCEPLYDLCYLDGAHDWTIDGLAVVLVERLLKPGGWLVLDDMTWIGEAGKSCADILGYSDEERAEPHMQAVFDLLVKGNPNFTELRIQGDLDWGWARKAPGDPRRMTIDTSRTLRGAAVLRLREIVRRRQRSAS